MANPVAVRKLTKELKELETNPVEGITVRANQSNILEWFFLFKGPVDTPFEGGNYIGTILFPSNFPFAPPDFKIITPNGRFQTNVKICMSNTGFHSDEWSPAWSLSSLLTGFISIMTDDKEHGIGMITTSAEHKKKLAKDSNKYNTNLPVYLEYFG